MNFKNKVKQLRAKVARSRWGFTLIELIVVIAILAILAGVGTAAYTGYVNRANKAADEQLLALVNKAFAAACAANSDDVTNLTQDDRVALDLNDDGTVDVDSLMPAKYQAAFAIFYEGNESAQFKYYSGLRFDSTLHRFTFSGGSTFDNLAVRAGIEDTFNFIGDLLFQFGTGDPAEIEETLKWNLGDQVSSTLGLDAMLDGYLKATQLKDKDLKDALEEYCPEYADLKTDTDKEAWIADNANADKIKRLKANLGVMHFANSANTGDSEQLLGNVMDSVDSIVGAALNFDEIVAAIDEPDIWEYYADTPRGREEIRKKYGGDAEAAHSAMLTDANSDYKSFMTTEDSMLGMTGTEIAVLSSAIGTGTRNEAGINTLGALYALSAGYFNNPDYCEANQGGTVQIGTFPTVVDALTDPGFKKYYTEMGEADIAAYLEQMRNLSNNENLDLTKDDVFTRVFTGGSN